MSQYNGRLDLSLNSSTPVEQVWAGGKGSLVAEATWSSGSVKLQLKSPHGTFIDIPNVSLTANGVVNFEIPPGTIKLVITTATAVYAYAVGMPQ